MTMLMHRSPTLWVPASAGNEGRGTPPCGLRIKSAMTDRSCCHPLVLVSGAGDTLTFDSSPIKGEGDSGWDVVLWIPASAGNDGEGHGG